MSNSKIGLVSNLETFVLDSLRSERVQEVAEKIFPELRDIVGASTPEERDLHVLRLENRLLFGRGQSRRRRQVSMTQRLLHAP